MAKYKIEYRLAEDSDRYYYYIYKKCNLLTRIAYLMNWKFVGLESTRNRALNRIIRDVQLNESNSENIEYVDTDKFKFEDN